MNFAQFSCEFTILYFIQHAHSTMKSTQYRIITLWSSHILFMITTTKLVNLNLTNETNLPSSCNFYYINFFFFFFFFLKSTSSKRTKNIVHVISRDEMTNDWKKKKHRDVSLWIVIELICWSTQYHILTHFIVLANSFFDFCIFIFKRS